MEVSPRAFNFIATHKPSLGVTGSHALPPEVAVRSPIDCALTALQCNHPTLGYSLPPVSVEAFPSRGALDVDGLFQQEFLRLPGLVNHRGVRHRRLLQRLGSACILVFLQPGPVFAWSRRCRLCHSCRERGTLRWPASPLAEHLSPWSTLIRGSGWT